FTNHTVLGIPGTSMWDTSLDNDRAIVDFLMSRAVVAVIQEPPSEAEKKKHLDSPAKMLAKIRAALPLTQVLAVRLWEFAPKNEHGDPVYKDVSGMWMHYGGEAGFTLFTQS